MPNLYKSNSSYNNINEIMNRGENKKPPKKKFDFKLYKKNTVKSLNDIEYFLNDFNRFFKYIKLYKIIKK